MVKNEIIAYEQIENMTRLIRLIDVLIYKVKQGVKIYILIYKEFSIALTLNSEHKENILRKLNENTKATKYPSFKDEMLWSDLCFGRYDNNQYPIYEAQNPENIYEFPFIDYSNSRIKDFSNSENYILKKIKESNKFLCFGLMLIIELLEQL